MNLRQLQHFAVLAETGNVHRASLKLNISQPALSKSIRALEEDLEVTLFERLPRGMRLTTAGAFLKSRAGVLLSEFQQLRTDIELIRRQSSSQLRIGAGTVLCASLVPASLARLYELAREIQVIVESGFWSGQKQMLLDGEIDFFVADARELEDILDFDLAPLPPEPIHIYTRPGHPLAGRPGLGFADLEEQAFSRLTRIPRELEQVVKGHPRLNLHSLGAAAVSSNDFSLLKATARQSDILLLSPPSAVAAEVGRGDLQRLDLRLPVQLQTRFALISLKHQPLSSAAQLLKQTILDCARAQAGG